MSGTTTICPCDAALPPPPTNLPGLDHIAYRAGTWREFRRALLTPLPGEQALAAWRPGGGGDLAVMMVEWWAYLADILAFYNERIANQDYLRTADLPESVNLLIALLGYVPRPAIGATGTLAALITPGQTATLPKGLQFQSKPAPGQPPQVFELDADTPIGAPDAVPATTPAALLAPQGGLVLLQGSQAGLTGSTLLLRARDNSAAAAARVTHVDVQPASGGAVRSALSLALTGSPGSPAAADARLDRANQTARLWSLYGGAIDATRSVIQLAGLARAIAPGDWLLFTAPGFTPALKRVAQTNETVWDATGATDTPTVPKLASAPFPVPHTQVTLADALDAQDWGGQAGAVTVAFDWVEAGVLLDQPPASFSGTPSTLLAIRPAAFPAATDRPVLVQDAAGAGMAATGTSAGGAALALGALPSPVPPLQSPLSVMFNLLPVSRGQTVAGEILGNGDATVAGQSFPLAKFPVTYLPSGAGYASTLAITVNGQPWTEVASFYGQPPAAQVFVASQDTAGQTHVQFGDGVNGARLPTGTNNVVARYRTGAGANSPPAGKLTVIAKSWPGLKSVLNPVAVSGGADPDPPARIRRYAPRSVLTFGRAVSVFDYEAMAAQAAGVTRARAVWAWDASRQRAVVRVFVGDGDGAVASAKSVLAAAGDPNRPVQVVQASALEVWLLMALVVTPGMDAAAIVAGVKMALADPVAGLFAPERLAIGQSVFDSQVEAATLAVPGAVAIAGMLFWAGAGPNPGPVHGPGEGAFYDLAPERVFIVTEPDPNG
jgi:predicted phage baseplate assembly protein